MGKKLWNQVQKIDVDNSGIKQDINRLLKEYQRPAYLAEIRHYQNDQKYKPKDHMANPSAIPLGIWAIENTLEG